MSSMLGLVLTNGTQVSHTDGPVVPIAAGTRSRVEQVSRKMPPNQIAKLLVQHGIKDITGELDIKRCCVDPIGFGGSGSVYRGKLHDGRLVAIKRIEMRGTLAAMDLGGGLCKQAAHELYTWSKCDHPGVLKSLGFAFFEGSILLISPWMQNGSLSGCCMRDTPFDKLQFCIDLAETVEHLHANGIVHGDIKAENILLSDSGRIQLVDFGSATLANYLTLCFTRTSPQLTWSVRFAAPEILDETSKRHTAESDIYALGMTILQILTGSPPYAEEPGMRFLTNVFNGTPPSRPSLNDILLSQSTKDDLWALLLRCWDHEPNFRPTAMEVKQILIGIKHESLK